MASLEESIVATLFDQADNTSDEVMHHNPLLSVLKSKNKIRKFSGGYEIRKPVMFNDTAQGGFYSEYQTFNLDAVTDLDAFQFAIKQCYEPFSLSGREKRANRDEEQLLDLVEQKMQATTSRLKNTVSTSLKGDGTLFSGKEFDGLKKMVSATPTTGTYGTLDRTTKTYAQNKSITSIGFTAANIQGELTNGIMATTQGDNAADLGFCHPTAWKYLHQSLTAIQRITTGAGSKGIAGFKTLEYDGCLFVFDGGYGGPSVAAGSASAVVESASVRLLQTDYISFDIDRQSDFKPLAPTMDRPVDQDAFFTIVLVEGNLCCSAPSLQLYMV